MKYSKDEEYLIKKYYPEYGSAGELGCVERLKKATGVLRKVRAVTQKARKMGLTYEGKNKGAFQKGGIPHNKGKTMSQELRDKVSVTWYKKGHLPHNTREDGALTIRNHKRSNQNYLYIRIAKAKWQLFQRYVYEQHYGIELKKNEVIRFRDENPYNFDIDNLQKVSRYQNLLLNNPRVNIPNDEELLKAYEILNNLKNRIKQLEDGTE